VQFEWRDFLSVASFLNREVEKSTVPEAFARCVVSRAYYAAFCHARNYARENYGYKPTRDAHDHERVQAHYDANRQCAVANQLDDLRKWRNMCDYQDSVPSVLGFPAKALKAAQKVLDALA
jgi:hypothetical protein